MKLVSLECMSSSPPCQKFETNSIKSVILEALRERRPPWPRQIITPILPTIKMLSLGGERLPPGRTSILFDLFHGLHNVFPLSLQNALLYERSK